MFLFYLPVILTGLIAVASIMAYTKTKKTSFLLLMVGFILQFLFKLLPLFGIGFDGGMLLGVLGWLGYLSILIGLLMVRGD
jgi:hypothetical protein